MAKKRATAAVVDIKTLGVLDQISVAAKAKNRLATAAGAVLALCW